MNYSAYFAPFLRGCIMEKTKNPYLVQSVDVSIANNAETIHIKIDEAFFENEKNDKKNLFDQKKIAELFTNTFARYDFIPVRIFVEYAKNTYAYITAPDFLQIENVKSNAQKTNWAIPKIQKSRNDTVKNKVALVTGGAQGFGEEMVRGLIQNGAIVCIADLNAEGAQKLAESLNNDYKKNAAFGVAVNVAEENSVASLLETITLTTGGLDICISNAGVLRASPILEQDIASFKFVTDINYTAFAIVTKQTALVLKRQFLCAPQYQSDIIQINSKSGLEGSNKNGSYAGGKFGGIGLVQSFALELIEYGIKVNAICPGNFFDGPLWSDPQKGLFVQYLNAGKVPGAKTIADVKKFYEAKVPMNRGCTGIDVLKAVLYIVEQDYETGQAVPVTGGQVMLH